MSFYRPTRRELLRLGLGSAFLSGCSRLPSAYFGRLQPPERNILRIGNAAEPRSLDPHKVQGVIGELNLSMALFDGLTEYHPRTLVPQPALALNWYPEKRATVWVFQLRPGARWSDGRPCTAQDFVYSWRRVVAPDTACPYANLLYFVRNGQAINEGKLPGESLGVSAPDDLTLRVEMEGPTAFFPLITSFFIFRSLPAWVIEAHGNRWARPETLVSNGAFTLLEHRPYDQVRLQRSDTYWDRARVQLEEVYFLPVTDPAQNVNLYQAGELDVSVGGVLPRPLLPALREFKDFHADGRFITYYTPFNCTRAPFDNLAVRRALSGVIERPELAERFIKGDAAPARHFIPPGIPGYRNPPAPAWQKTASSALPKRFTLSTMNREPDRTIAQVLQRTWKARFGITVEIASEEAQTFLARLRTHDYEVAIARWGGDYLDPTTFLNLFNGLNPQNYPNWDDQEYQARLALARVEADAARRYALLAKAEERLLAQSPIAPLFHTGLEYLQKPWVVGWEPNLQDLHPLKYVRIDRNWSGRG